MPRDGTLPLAAPNGAKSLLTPRLTVALTERCAFDMTRDYVGCVGGATKLPARPVSAVWLVHAFDGIPPRFTVDGCTAKRAG